LSKSPCLMYKTEGRGNGNEHKKTERSRSVDIARGGELVEAELDRFIATRSRRDPDAEEREELWKESVRRYNARRSEVMRAAWCVSTTRARPRATGPSWRP